MAKNKKKSKNIQYEVKEQAHKIWLAGLGALAMAEEEGGKVFRSLVERGESIEVRGREQMEKARGAVSGVKVVAESYLETFERTLDEKVSGVISRLGVPTKNEIDTLSGKVEDLAAAIAKLKKGEAAPKVATRTTRTPRTPKAPRAPKTPKVPKAPRKPRTPRAPKATAATPATEPDIK
jgi:poly(hydroxyalkanoate) granule-associated protein